MAPQRGEQTRGETHSSRSRSFGGCAACRKRRLKCDEARPKCSACTKSGWTCTYEKSLFFGVDDEVDLGGGRYRRPVLSERERETMSEWLTNSVAPHVALRRIADIDEECEATNSSDVQITYGPFGAFRVNQRAEEPSHTIHQESSEVDAFFRPNDGIGDLHDLLLDTPLSPGTQDILTSIFDQPAFDQSRPVQPDLWDCFPIMGRVEEVLDDFPLPSLDAIQTTGTKTDSFWIREPAFQFPSTRPPSPWLFPSITKVSNAVPQEAVALLKHYQTTVLRLLTPFRHSKTPWHILFLPQAKNCLAALTLGEDVDHASLCVFHGTLSISAFSMGGILEASNWTEFANSSLNLARKHARATLQTAYHVPKTAKYKSILTALLTMVQLSMVTGNTNETEFYFVEAEKFIRVKGLHRRKSRKVRLLHHCYAFERILFESTRASNDVQDARQQVPDTMETDAQHVAGEDAVFFRLKRWTNLELAMKRVKDRVEGENDLHLQIPGDWPATLYPEIFGVPEQLIQLLSLIIQLAKEKEKSGAPSDEGPGLSLKGFLDRAKAIELLIHRLSPSTDTDGEPSHLVEAMKTALCIYFYRRIYDVDATVLQSKVVGVLNCLPKIDSARPESVHGAARFIWPAFVAACEAEQSEVQLAFSSWFRGAAQHSGLRVFTTTLANAERPWQARLSGRRPDLVYPISDPVSMDDDFDVTNLWQAT